jgi:sirohydrochlorin cobaltochelatase
MTEARVLDELKTLEAKIHAILPPRYVGCFEEVPSGSMGSATLKYDKEGTVAWGEIWTTFCHLALAGGPPHRGSFLGAVATAEVLARPAEQAAVVAEIQRAIGLSANLPTVAETAPGWVGVRCHDEDMAAWLVRAIVAENVIARHEGKLLLVPAAPAFRIEKEIKNVVVCVAKTCHYLLDHVEPEERPRGFGDDLIQPPLPEEIAEAADDYRAAMEELRAGLSGQTEMDVVESKSTGWIGLRCAREEMAIWMMRAVIVENILARREADVLFVPVCVGEKQIGSRELIRQAVAQGARLWELRTADSNEAGEHRAGSDGNRLR